MLGARLVEVGAEGWAVEEVRWAVAGQEEVGKQAEGHI